MGGALGSSRDPIHKDDKLKRSKLDTWHNFVVNLLKEPLGTRSQYLISKIDPRIFFFEIEQENFLAGDAIAAIEISDKSNRSGRNTTKIQNASPAYNNQDWHCKPI